MPHACKVDAVYAAMNMNPAHRFVPTSAEGVQFGPFVPMSFIAGLLVVPCFACPTLIHSPFLPQLHQLRSSPQSKRSLINAVWWLAAALSSRTVVPFQIRCRIWCSRELSHDVLVDVRLLQFLITCETMLVAIRSRKNALSEVAH